MSQHVIQELCDFTKSEESFKYAHIKFNSELLRKFLQSTMDEARLRFADQYATEVLHMYGIEDWAYFRQGVHRREVAGEVSFDGQRDHSAHTLNNYLLGAYFWQHAPELRKELVAHMNQRGIEASGEAVDSSRFFNLWVMVSLLHDIGYLFEGAAMPGTTKHASNMSALGADVVREYFNSRFWVDSDVTAPSERRVLLERAEVRPFELNNDGFSSILESLRDVGDLSKLRVAINNHIRKQTLKTPDMPPIHDAFAAWREHYQSFGANGMSERISELERYVHSCIYAGLGSSGIRMLDHGSCSGLLMLRASTYFYSIRYGIQETKGHKPLIYTANQQYAIERFLNSSHRQGMEYTPDWWWRGICWATAAAALHNHLQMEDPNRKQPLLKVSDDPLTYLGVLVDIVEEWDRFRVKSNALAASAPLQGVDVNLGHENGMVVISYPSGYAKKVRDNLSKAIDGWDKFLKIEDI